MSLFYSNPQGGCGGQFFRFNPKQVRSFHDLSELFIFWWIFFRQLLADLADLADFVVLFYAYYNIFL